MTPNPVCYNRLSQSKAAIHMGQVSLGVTPKDYRADTAQKWRAGISPSSNIVLYSDTYSRSIDTQANAVPRIWWIDGTGTYTDKITELVSRLPERSSVDYALLADYPAAIAWLKASGKYTLINCDYPEYKFADSETGCQTIANIESGYLGSYYGGGDTTTFNLANPTANIGFGTHAPAAFKVNDFNLVGGVNGGQPNGNAIGLEQGFTLLSGAIEQSTTTDASTYANGFVFEGIFGGLAANDTLFEIYDTVASRAVYQVRVTNGGDGIEVLNSVGGLAYRRSCNVGLTQESTYITFSHAPGASPTFQMGEDPQIVLTTVSPITWTNPTKWVVGAHLMGGTYSENVDRVKAFKIHLASSTVTAADLQSALHTPNWALVGTTYAV